VSSTNRIFDAQLYKLRENPSQIKIEPFEIQRVHYSFGFEFQTLTKTKKNFKMFVIKRDGRKEPVHFDKVFRMSTILNKSYFCFFRLPRGSTSFVTDLIQFTWMQSLLPKRLFKEFTLVSLPSSWMSLLPKQLLHVPQNILISVPWRRVSQSPTFISKPQRFFQMLWNNCTTMCIQRLGHQHL
jgi:hypothetical protein